jgi:SAM-dependent methyltransferase
MQSATIRSAEGSRPAPPELRDVATPEGLAAAVRDLGDEPGACLVCGAPSPRRLFHGAGLQGPGKWHWQCRACALVFVHDIYPEFVTDVDGQAHLEFGRENPPGATERRRWAEALAEFEPYRALGTLLDVGCGTGNFLGEAARAGWSVKGVETLTMSAAVAREERGLDVRGCDLISAAFEDDAFDAVYMTEVIEHIVDPLELMGELRRVLRPGGVALVLTGCVESWSARLRGGDWPYYGFCAGGHIRFFGPRSARALGRAAGFTRVTTSTRGFALRDGSELEGRWYRPLVRLAQAPLSPLAGLAGRGHRLTMRFVK